MRWIVAVALVAAIGAGTANAAPAGPPGPQGPAGPGPALCRSPALWKQALGLSDQQVAALERAAAALRERTGPLRIEAARAELDLREAMLPDNPDAAKVEAAVSRIDRARGQILRATVAFRLEIKRVLSPEQEARAELLLRECARRARGGP